MRLTSDPQFHSDFTPCLGGITFESLQQSHDLGLVFHICHQIGLSGFPRGISLPDAIHHLMTSKWPPRAASLSGVSPERLSRTLKSPSSRRTQEVRPLLQAIMKVVHPSWYKWKSLAGCASRMATMASCPSSHALHRAPSLDQLMSKLESFLRIAFTSSTLPSLAASRKIFIVLKKFSSFLDFSFRTPLETMGKMNKEGEIFFFFFFFFDRYFFLPLLLLFSTSASASAFASALACSRTQEVCL